MADTPSYWGQWFVPATITYNGQTYSTGGYAAPITYNADGTATRTSPTTTTTTSGSGGGGGGTTTTTSRASLIEQFQAIYPYFPRALIRVFVDAFIEHGDVTTALAVTRQDSRYDTLFPGLRRDDGSLRLGSEGEYLAYVEGYRTRLASFGVPRSVLTTERIVSLIEGNVDPIRFGQTLDLVYTQVATNLPEIRAAYAAEFGIDPNNLSLAAIFASAIDPQYNPVEMEFKIRRAQITGEADIAGFDIPVAESTRLAERGLDQQAARNFYSQARTILPTLGTLVDRHNDPDDDFSLTELTDALVFLDPDQQQRINRLFAQEESLFSTTALFSLRSGTLPGLVAD